ncbi:hemophore-related protein [Mycolicibacterium diernhoferi]
MWIKVDPVSLLITAIGNENEVLREKEDVARISRVGKGKNHMLKVSRTKLAVLVGGMALSVPMSVGIASAQPDLGPVIHTTCNYDQVWAAMNAERPDLAAQFNAQPMALGMLRSFLNSSPADRQGTVNQIAAYPGAQSYLGATLQLANSCHNY